MDVTSATWLSTALLFGLVIGGAFYVSRPRIAERLKWYREGVVWLFLITAYYPLSVYGILHTFYRDISQTSLRNEWQAMLISSTAVMSILVAIMLGLVLWAVKRPGYQWYKEGLVAAVSLSLCYWQLLMMFVRTH